MKRRNFLRIMGVSAGSLILSSCNGNGANDNESAHLLSPDGYVFFRLDTFNEKSFDLRTAMITNDSRIIYQVREKATKKDKLIALKLDYNGIDKPIIQEKKIIVQSGTKLEDGNECAFLKNYNINDNGRIVLNIIQTDNQHLQTLHQYDLNTQKISKIFKHNDTFENFENTKVVGKFGDFELDNQNHLLFVSGYTYPDVKKPVTGLFYKNLDGIETTKIISSNEMFSSTEQVIHGIGLIDKSKQSDLYSVQLFIKSINQELPQFSSNIKTIESASKDVIIKGNITLSNYSSVLIPSSLQGTSANLPQSVIGFHPFGARVGSNEEIILVAKDTDGLYTLYKTDNEILKEGEKTPIGNVIESFGGYSMSENSFLFTQVSTVGHEDELILFDGSTFKTIITTRTKIDDKLHAPMIIKMLFGGARNGVDRSDRIVLIATFDDGTQSLLVGLPV